MILLEQLSRMRVKFVTCPEAVTLLRPKMGRMMRSRVLDLPDPASPIKNRCGNFTLLFRRCDLIKQAPHHARIGTHLPGSLYDISSAPRVFNCSFVIRG